jgi:competence protein ComEA
VKVKRRTPDPDPGDRLRALARLRAAGPETVGRDEELGRDEEVRGGWIPDPVLPERLRGSRWSLAPRHVAVVTVVLVLGLAWAGWSVFHNRPEVVPDARPATGIVSGSPVGQPSPSGAPASSPSTQVVVVVDVSGKVRRPGLVRAKAGSRVADVLALADGALPGVDLTNLNLARQVADGEQILVGVPGGVPAGTPAVSPGGPSGTAQVDLNTATVAQLEALPGVGPVLAQRIVDWRTEHGRFSTVDELQEVSGVGEKKFESLKPHVRI